jgi:hypothetical protein
MVTRLPFSNAAQQSLDIAGFTISTTVSDPFTVSTAAGNASATMTVPWAGIPSFAPWNTAAAPAAEFATRHAANRAGMSAGKYRGIEIAD